jgi:hypothetical protein
MVYVCTANKGSLYDQFHTGIKGVSPLHAASHTFDQIASAHEADQASLKSALGAVSVTYTGTAASTMQSAFQSLLDSLGAGVQKATAASSVAQQQAGHFTAAQNQIQNDVPVPSQPWYEGFVPWNTSYDNAKSANSSIDSGNQAAFQAYAKNTQGNNPPTFQAAGNQPSQNTNFTVNNTPQLNPGMPSSGGSGIGPHATPASSYRASAAPSVGAHSSSFPGAPAHSANPSAPAGSNPGSPSGPPTAPPPVSGSGSTTAQGYTGPVASPSGSSSGWGSSAPGSSAAMGGASGGWNSGSSGGYGPVGGFGPTAGGSGAWGGSGSSGGGLAGGGLSGGGSAGSAGRSGATSGVGSGPESATSGAGTSMSTGRAGTAGSLGMAGGGAGGGRKREDAEHQTSAYLVNQDNGNAIVGDLEPTIPPVIGG